MSPPIREGSGSSIGSIRLGDGSEISEVRTGAGDVLFSAIPDVENLHARYDARRLSLSDGQQVSTWDDEVANADLSIGAGSPTYIANAINGVPAVSYDGDGHDATFGSAISDPYSVFFSGQLQTRDQTSIAYADNPIPASGFVGFEIEDGGFYQWKINGTNDPSLGSNDTTAHIFSNLFNSGTGVLRVDSSAVGSKGADSTSNDFEGVSLGMRSDGVGGGDILITEILVYSVDESSNQSEIENYLDRDLGLI